MLNQLKKKLMGDKPDEALEAVDGFTAATEMSVQLQEAVSQLEQLNSVIAQKDALLAEMNGKLEQLSSYAAEAEAKAAEVVAQAKAKELVDKRTMLADVIGADNAGLDATFAAISGLEMSAFSTVVSGFAASFAKEAESEMFTEIGVPGEAEASTDASESREMAILKQKYNK